MKRQTLQDTFRKAGIPYREPRSDEHWLGVEVTPSRGEPVPVSVLAADGRLRVTAHRTGHIEPLAAALTAANQTSLDWMLGGIWVADDTGDFEASAAIPIGDTVDPTVLRQLVYHVAEVGRQIRDTGRVAFQWEGNQDIEALIAKLPQDLGINRVPGGFAVPFQDANGVYATEFLTESGGLLVIRTRRAQLPAVTHVSKTELRCGQASRRFGWGAFVHDEQQPVVYHIAGIPTAWVPIEKAELDWILDRSAEAAATLVTLPT